MGATRRTRWPGCLQKRNNGDPFFQGPPETAGLDADRYFRGKDVTALARAT